MTKKSKESKEPKICLNCGHCIYIGDGDYMCDADKEPIIVMEEHCPNDNYWWCAESEWESEY